MNLFGYPAGGKITISTVSPVKSHAQWPLECCKGQYGDGVTSDVNYSESHAISVCRALMKDGFGGEGKYFPEKVWVTDPLGKVVWEKEKGKREVHHD